MKPVAGKILTLACAAALTLGVACSPKQKNLHTADDFFALYDADKSGDVTKEEFMAKWKDKEKAEKIFQQIDSASAGKIQRGAVQDIEDNASVWSEADMDDSTAQEP